MTRNAVVECVNDTRMNTLIMMLDYSHRPIATSKDSCDDHSTNDQCQPTWNRRAVRLYTSALKNLHEGMSVCHDRKHFSYKSFYPPLPIHTPFCRPIGACLADALFCLDHVARVGREIFGGAILFTLPILETVFGEPFCLTPLPKTTLALDPSSFFLWPHKREIAPARDRLDS